MKNSLKFLRIIVLLLTFTLVSKTETLWETESDAEEEEEKENTMLRNGSFRSTFALEDDPTTKTSLLDPLIETEDNGLWSRRLNLTEFDELHVDNIHDVSPENNVDQDSLDKEPRKPMIGPRNKPVNESALLSKGELVSTQETSASEGIANSTTALIETGEVTLLNVTTTFDCIFGDRKCKSSQGGELRPLKFGDKLTSPSDNSVSTGLFWNAVRSNKFPESERSETSEVSFSTMSIPTFERETPVLPETTSAQTSDNVILIDGTELEKDESVIQTNKSEKIKPMKHEDEIISNEMSNIKITITSSLQSPTKEIYSFPDMPSSILTPDASQLLTNLSKIDTPIYLEPSIPVELITPTIKHMVTETESLTIPDSPNIGKMLEDTSDDYSKMPPTLSPSLLNTPSWNNDKGNAITVIDKHFKGNTANALDVIPLSPSFRQSVESRETKKAPTFQSTPIVTQQTTVTTTSQSFSPKLDPKLSTSFAEIESTSQPALREIDLPPRLSYPSCSSLPVCVEVTLLETTWEQFCRQTSAFREFLSSYVSSYTRPIRPRHLIIDSEICSKSLSVKPLQTSPDVTVAFYVTNDTGEYEERLTEICGIILRKWTPTSFRSSVLEVRLPSTETQSLPLLPEFNSGFVAAVSISAVAGVALCMLCILLVIMKQKLMAGRGSSDTTTTPTADAYSLDSLSINASFRRKRIRRSARSYLNHAFNDQEIPSHPLDLKSLTNCLKSRDLLEEEFKKIPMNMAKLDSIPEGAHVKNRYSNILPRPETRVVIAEGCGDPLKSYINANFVKGYEGKSSFYIACQASLPEGIEDFWRMVWEQQTRVVIMLTMFEENGISRCAQYFPQSTIVSHPPFGDFQVSLVKKDVYEFYTKSTLRLLDLEKNLFRDVVHLWFTGWPDAGVPKDPSSLITFIQQCRSYLNSNTGPTVVHCSTGTGRTGVFLTLDMCMREYEESRSIDILQCVSQLRRDRGGAVQNKDQYILIYEALLEYVSRLANQSHCPSTCSKNSREK